MSENNPLTPIAQTYVEWANTLDSSGQDSSEAIKRLQGPHIMEILIDGIEMSIRASQNMEDIKKFIFYGKPLDKNLPLVSAVPKSVRDEWKERINNHNVIRILHALMGLAGESGEMLEPMKYFILDGTPLDLDNLAEEGGDILWYEALLAKGLGHLTLDEFMLGNKAKLTARYGTEWTKDGALNRDTVKEMRELAVALKDTPAVVWDHPITSIPIDDIMEAMSSLNAVSEDRKSLALEKFPTLSSVVDQLSACHYETEAGYLENNLAFVALRQMAHQEWVNNRRSAGFEEINKSASNFVDDIIKQAEETRASFLAEDPDDQQNRIG